MSLDPNINTLEKRKFLEYAGETCLRVYLVNPPESREIKNYGRENVILGQDYVTIVFDTPMLAANFTAIITIETDDSEPIFLSYVIKNMTVNGMMIKFNAPVDSSDYYVHWAVMESQS